MTRTTFLLILVAFALSLSQPAHGASGGGWPNWGNGITNNHRAADETCIRPATAHQLRPKWKLDVPSDVTAVPTVSADGRWVYFPDWNGNVWCVSAATGAVRWSVRLDAITGIVGIIDNATGISSGSLSRNSPALWEDLVLLGDLASGWFFGLNATDGQLVWRTLLDPHPNAVITMSATVHRDRVLVGVSSTENQFGAVPEFPCCTFRGSFAALHARSGRVEWQTYMTPANYSGAPVWGSSPSVDDQLGLVYVGTGNNYRETPDIRSCREQGTPPGQCLVNPHNHVDSIVAMRLTDGAVAWARSFAPGDYRDDAYNLGCNPNYFPANYSATPNSNCPAVPGADADFGQAPMLIAYEVTNDRGRRETRRLVTAGQKNGMMVALNPATGALAWARKAGPAGLNGGAQWGAAFDGQRIVVAITNSNFAEVQGLVPSGGSTYGGLWTALDPADGSILWQTAVPEGQTLNSSVAAASGATAYSAVTAANGVFFVGSSTKSLGASNYFALQADTGRILWDYAPGGSAVSGPSVVSGSVYWGCGYARIGRGCKTFYAFSVPSC